MHLSHLGLPVRDERRSQRFYAAYFGFDPATAQDYEDGTVIIRNADRFDLALHPVGHVEPSPAFLHAGFKAAEPAEVRALMARMQADGVTIAERNDEAVYVAFKCLDPHGHRSEVYWEPRAPGNAHLQPDPATGSLDDGIPYVVRRRHQVKQRR
jgi:catechol 2,3-dioxygenase-like lactoylglutathione lyase family enzyme